jgi:hypothetical protein
MSVDYNEATQKLLAKFEKDVIQVIYYEAATGRLNETGTARLSLRASIESIYRAGEIQLNEVYLLKLSMAMAYGLKAQGEFSLASEVFKQVIERFESRESSEFEMERIVGKVEAIVGEVECDYALSSVSPQTRSAPMSVSILLRCIHRVRGGLEILAELTTKQQEGLAWLYLNCCKVIIEIGQPLVWTSCGKYIVNSFMFAIACIEDVINLCTWRHLQFRMKLYNTAFYGALTQLGVKEAQNILNQLKRQYAELRERESLDLPIPDKVECALAEADLDVAVMTRVLSFWKDPESLKVAEAGARAQPVADAKPEKGAKSVKPAPAAASAVPESANSEDKGPDVNQYACLGAKAIICKRWFGDRVLCECARMQQMTSGNPNEMWKKRLNSILRAFWAVFETVNVDTYEYILAKSLNGEHIEGGTISPPHNESAETVDKPKLSLESLSIMAVLIMFGVIDDIPIGSVLAKIWTVLDKVSPVTVINNADTIGRAFDKYLAPSEPGDNAAGLASNVDRDCLQALTVLRELAHVIDAVREGDGHSNKLDSLLTAMTGSVNSLTFSDDCFRRKSLLHRVAISIWSKFVYKRLQQALNSVDSSSSLETLEEIAIPLVTSVKVLDITFIEDPVLMATLAALSATILHEVGDNRGAISLLKRSLELIEVHRSNRVDAAMHLPDDARNISALQRASITTDRDEIDWFHGVKRLGAHAFAGFGIFGAGSTTDPSDLALADAHADMLSLYFRYELEYSIDRYYSKKEWKETESRLAAIEESKSELAKSALHKTTRKTHSPGRTGSAQLPVNAENLSCVQVLRAFCSKNNYARSILHMEMALVDTDPERRQELLSGAAKFIKEAETREAALIECFNDLSLVADMNRAPIVLARSHRCVYLAPVSTKKQVVSNPAVKYFRILAKEQGSGTDISISSDFIGGTETKVDISSYNNPSAGLVCIQPLRPGERYVFGCAAFTVDNNPIGSVSPTSAAVDAVNPLSTAILWGFLNRVSVKLAISSIAVSAADSICSRFFDYSEPQSLRCVGRGINIHIDEEPILCMLAVEKSSPVALQYFVSSFLTLEDKLRRPPGSDDSNSKLNAAVAAHWDKRKALQSHLITSIRKTAIVASIASQLRNHELIVRTVVLGYSLCCDLFTYDEQHLASYLLPSLMIFIVSLQFVPKRHWHTLEHALYCRLLTHACKLSIYCRNTSPMSVLLMTTYSESKDANENKISQEADLDYLALLRSVGLCNRILLPPSAAAPAPAAAAPVKGAAAAPSVDTSLVTMNSTVEMDLAELLTSASKHGGSDTFFGVDYLWARVPASKQPAFAFGLGAALSAVEHSQQSAASNLYRWLQERPGDNMSVMMSMIAQLCQELGSQGKGNRIVHLLNRAIIYDKYLAPITQTLIGEYRLKFISVLPTPEEQATTANAQAQAQAAAAAAGAGNKGAKKGQPVEEVVIPTFTPEQFAVPQSYINANAGEVQKQLLALGNIACWLATGGYEQIKDRSYFPTNRNGPFQVYEPASVAHLQIADKVRGLLKKFQETPEPVILVVADPTPALVPAGKDAKKDAKGGKGAVEEAAPAVLKVPLNLISTRNGFVKHICVAIVLFAKSFSPQAVVGACVQLWNVIVNDWCDAEAFAESAVPVKTCLHDALSAVVVQFELLLGMYPAVLNGSVVDANTAITDENTLFVELTKQASPVSPRAMKEFALQIKDLYVFLVKVLWLCKCYKDVVDLGSRGISVYIAMAPEFGKSLGYAMLPLIKHSQERIIDECNILLDLRKQSLADCMNNFEELMKKKRRKKLRIARVEKDEDELAFEAERDAIQALVDAADTDLKLNLQRMTDIETQEKLFNAQYGTGIQLLDKVRIISNEIIADAMSELEPEDHGDIRRVLARSREIAARIDLAVEQYTKVGHFLREKKDRITLIELLKEQSDFLLMFGKLDEVKLGLFDVVDGFFNVMDAVQNWRTVVEKCLPVFDTALLGGVMPVVVALGKLSKYAGARDWDLKSNCCRLASEVCRVAFSESYGHPQTLVGLAAYECRNLGGLGALAFNSDKLTSLGLRVACEEVINQLHYEELYIEELPLIVVLEHLHGAYTMLPEAWMQARLKRIRCLVCAGLFAEAASMIASIIPTINAITNRTYSSLLNSPISAATGGGDKGHVNRAAFDTSSNCLEYHGRSPYFNHLPPHAEENSKTLAWIANFTDEFKEFSKHHVIKMPLSVEEMASRKAAQEKAAAAAAAAAATDKKGAPSKKDPKAGAPEEAVVVENAETLPRFDRKLIGELALVCGQLHLHLSQLDGRSTTGHAQKLKALSVSGLKLVDACLELLGDSKPINIESVTGDGNWMLLYCQARLQKAAQLLHGRQYKSSKASILSLMQLLQGLLVTKNANVYYPPNAPITPLAGIVTVQSPLALYSDVQAIVCQSWNTCKNMLVRIAERQSRLVDVVTISTQNCKDASRILSSFWLISSLLLRIRANFKLGNLAECEADIAAALDLTLKRFSENTVSYIQLLVLQVSVVREMGLSCASDQYAMIMKRALSILRKARICADELARSYGFVGADSNITFFKSSSPELEFERLPPLLHNLSDIHCNEPKLSLKPNINKNLFREVLPNNILAALENRENAEHQAYVNTEIKPQHSKVKEDDQIAIDDESYEPNVLCWNGRLGPITSNEQSATESEFGNIYLRVTRELATVHASLASLLMEVMNSNATVDDEPSSGGSSGGNSGYKRPATARQRDMAREIAKKYQLFSRAKLVRELIAISEDGLKVCMYYCDNFACDVRLSCLFVV